MNEVNIIYKYFNWPNYNPNCLIGIGDDAALLNLNSKLLISTDTSVAGVHYEYNADPYSIGWKSLAVSISDIAAMGGYSKYFLLNLTLANIDDAWLERFSLGVRDLANRYGIIIIGGDTVRGPLSITTTVLGEASSNGILRRSGAKVGDTIWIGGSIGLAALYRSDMKRFEFLRDYLDKPIPQVELGSSLASVASSAIDLSDSLDLNIKQLLSSNNLSALIYLDSLFPEELKYINLTGIDIMQYVLFGGDDYKLLFTVPSNRDSDIKELIIKYKDIRKIGILIDSKTSNNIRYMLNGCDLSYKYAEHKSWSHY